MLRFTSRICSLILALVVSVSAGAFTWEPVGMEGIATTCIAIDEAHGRVLVGTYEGFHYYDLATGDWTERDEEGSIGRQVHALLAHPTLDQRVISGRENAFFKGYLELSDDLGVSGEVVHMSQGGAFVDLAREGSHFYACGISDITPGELLRSDDGGETWAPLTGHGHTAMTSLLTVNGLYVGGDGGVALSWDDGANWDPIGGGLPAGDLVECLEDAYAGGDVLLLEVLAGTASGIYYGWENGIGDWQWDSLSAEPCEALARAWVPAPWPQNVSVRFAAVTGDGRVLFSDSMAVWSDETGDLPAAAVDIAYVLEERALYVATAGAGVFRVRHVLTPVDEVPGVAGVDLRAWPNPFNPRVQLRWELPESGLVSLRIVDLAGREVARLLDGWLDAGPHQQEWAAAGLASGVYVAHLSTGGAERTCKLVLAR